ncbi:MAG: hypothetical protein DIJKHBIC_03970 [Thermoanaerobaculia bacterium]|nr:hypothetical protein [Thermoanaerobaculia bacterium]
MKAWIGRIGQGAFLLVSVSLVSLSLANPSLAARLLIVGADSISYFPVTELTKPPFTQVDTFDSSSSTPTLVQLQGYEAVLCFTNYSPANAVGLGDVLKSYVDGGGKVVLSTYAFSSPWAVAGGIMTTGYSPLINTGTNGDVSGGFNPLVPSDVVFSFPNQITPAAISYFHNGNFSHPGLDAGATVLADDGGGIPLFAINAAGNVGGLNMFVETGYSNSSEFYEFVHNTLVRVLCGGSVIDTQTGWNGSDSVGPFGLPVTPTYGQVITAPATGASLLQFTFQMQLPTTVVFRGEVYAWDGSKATGANLYESAPRSTTQSATYESVTFSIPGGVPLAANAQYVIFASASKDTGTGAGQWGFRTSSAYPGGGFVYMNNGTDATAWTTTAWDQSLTYGDAVMTVNLCVLCTAPTAVVSGSGIVCNGQPATIQAALTGTAPWTVTWSDGFIQTGVTASPAVRTVAPAVTTVYTVTALTDASCSASPSDLTGSATVNVNSRPTSSVTGGGTVCAGTVSTINAALTGVAPWTLKWNDGYVQVANASPATRQVSPTFNMNYWVTDLSDGNCTALPSDLTGSAAFVVKPLASAVITAPGGLCASGTGYTASVPDGGPGVTYAWGIAGGTITSVTNAQTVTFNAPASGTVVLTVTVTRDGCPNVGTKTMAVAVAPATPSGLYPPNGTTGYQGAIVAWNPASGAAYDVYFDTVTPPEKLLASGLVDNFEAFIPNWQPGVTYYWKVVARNACNEVASGIQTLTTGTCAFTGAAPVLTNPVARATGLPKSLTLTWNTVPGVSHFDVYLGPSAESLLRYEALPAERSSLAVDLAPGQTYFWKVVAVPVCGTSAPSESAVQSFATAASNVTFGAVSPAYVNRWGFTGDLSLSGSGFVASSLLFTDLDGATAGTLTPSVFTNSFSNPNLLTATLVASATAPAGRYDVGVMEGAIEKGRSIQSLSVRAFTDVTEADYYFESSAEVADAGIMEGDMDTEAVGPQFTPNATVPRKLMAEYLAKAYQWWRTRSAVLPAATCETPDFPDVPCAHPNWLAIHWIKTWGITVGVPCAQGTCFNPDGSVSRAELVTFLDRMKQTAILSSLLSTTGETDPGCSQAYPACSGWADAGMKVAGWPRREANIAYSDRLTKGCAGTPGNGLAFCPYDTVSRAQIGEFLARMVGLVPTP